MVLIFRMMLSSKRSNTTWSLSTTKKAYRGSSDPNIYLIMLGILFQRETKGTRMVEQPSTQITEDEAKLYDRQIRYSLNATKRK